MKRLRVSDSDDSPESKPERRKQRRESAVEATKKLQLHSELSSPGKSRKEAAISFSKNCTSSGLGKNHHSNEPVCDRGCFAVFPGCSAEISENCIGEKVQELNRWIHISDGEHICQPCYDEFTKPGKAYSEKFRKWKMAWSLKSRREPIQRLYVAEELLPFWMQCIKCSRWRPSKKQSVDPGYIRTFHCGLESDSFIDKKFVFVPMKLCVLNEDPRVQKVKEESWLQNLTVPPLLWSSPANFFLNDEYFDDEVGMSPTHTTDKTSFSRDKSLEELMQPFYVPTEPGRAMCLRPDVMEYDEIIEFPEYVGFEAFGFSHVHQFDEKFHVNLRDDLPGFFCSYKSRPMCFVFRGLMRVRCITELERIIRFLTLKGVINFGLLNGKCPYSVFRPDTVKKLPRVLVIGAGVSGLSVARQLSNFGMDVSVIEAKKEIGGRMRDDWSLGVAVGKGAQLATGVINNPIIIMCAQGGVGYRNVSEECPLLDIESGELADTNCDKRVDFHFNCLLDAVADWRKTSPDSEDHSVEEMLMHVHQQFLKDSKLKWSEAEERLFQFQLGNLEFSCGASLRQVSARHWDQNEQFAQFGGDHALLTDGGWELISRLGKNLNIHCNTKVCKIDYSGKRIVVYTRKGKKYYCEKVVIALPLAVLQQLSIEYVPEMPERKMDAIISLGAGIIEKVAVKFPRKFWSSRVNGSDYFGHVPANRESRGLFNLFYDFSTRDSRSKNQSYVLMSYMCGDSVNIVNEKSDQEVTNLFVETLQKLFPEENIPEPEGCIVTHWGRDSCYGMSYSYVKMGSSGKDYDVVAEDIDKKIFFAGEATNRHFPQTMTGAYLTGLREAGKIVSSINEHF